jgi:c-di-GMP-binding flagellar brake protein YcgR
MVDFTGLDMSSGMSSQQILTFVIIFAVVVLALAIINRIAKKNTGGGGGKGGFAALFSGLTLIRMARSMGLNSEQIKMMNYAFSIDAVEDPEKSLYNSALLDRHFRRAYRAIEANTPSEQEKQYKHAVLFSTRNILENNAFGGLTSTRQAKDDHTLVITHNKDRFQCDVIQATNEHLAVECPHNALGSLIKPPKGSKITAILFTRSNKGFSFESRIAGYGPVQNQTAMLLAHSNNLRFLSKRRYRRRQCNLATNLYLVYVEGKGKKQRLIVDKRRLAGSVSDISVGGCSIKTRVPIQVGSRMKIEFSIGDNNVATLGQILRTNRTSLGTIVHVKFLKVTRKSMNAINAYVYEFTND